MALPRTDESAGAQGGDIRAAADRDPSRREVVRRSALDQGHAREGECGCAQTGAADGEQAGEAAQVKVGPLSVGVGEAALVVVAVFVVLAYFHGWG